MFIKIYSRFIKHLFKIYSMFIQYLYGYEKYAGHIASWYASLRVANNFALWSHIKFKFGTIDLSQIPFWNWDQGWFPISVHLTKT